MHRVVILGRGGAGKSATARRLGEAWALPVIELDALFWGHDQDGRPMPTEPAEWTRAQRELADRPEWIIDGDLGEYDDLGPRLSRADAVLVLDFGLARCAWRAFRRSRENAEFWRWLALWRVSSRPVVLDAIARYATQAEVHRVRSPRALDRAIAELGRPGLHG